MTQSDITKNKTASLRDLTIIIPTYNRHRFLFRNLEFWNDLGPQIHVLDGAQDAIPEDDLKKFGTNVYYHHWPISWQKRLDIIRKFINTKYVVQLHDDDLFLPSGVMAAMQALEDDPTLVACSGRPLGFGWAEGGYVFGVPGVYQDMFEDYAVDADSPASRMMQHMGRYMPSTICAILRSDAWIKSIELFSRYEFPVFSIGELQIELSTSYLGKSKVIPCISWLRSIEAEGIVGPDASLFRTLEFHTIWHLPEFKESFRKKFLNGSSEVFSEFDGRRQEDIAIEIEAAMDSYVEWCNAYLKRQVFLYSTREYLKRIMPKYIINLLIKYLRKRRSKLSQKNAPISLLELGRTMEGGGTHVNILELTAMTEMIYKFHTKNDI